MVSNISKSKLRLFAFAAILLFLIISFAACEVILRIIKPQRTYSELVNMVKTGEYVKGEFNPFTLKKNGRFEAPSMEYPGKTVNITTNSLGLRGPEITLEKPADTKRILILGDSYTYGVFVEDHETYPAVLEELFRRENQNVHVINAGYADGWSPEEHYCWLVNRGLKFEPDIIIYGFFIGNDLDVRGPEWVEVDERGLPTKIINPQITVDENGMIRSLAKDNKTAGVQGIYRVPILRESHFSIFMFNRYERFISSLKSKNNRGWGYDPFPFILKAQSDEKMLKQEKKFKEIVVGLNQVAVENQAKFMMLMIPINFQVYPEWLKGVVGSNKFKIQRNYFDELKPWLNEESIAYLDLLKLMQEMPGRYYPKNKEVHFNPQGNRFAAEQLKAALDQQNYLE